MNQLLLQAAMNATLLLAFWQIERMISLLIQAVQFLAKTFSGTQFLQLLKQLADRSDADRMHAFISVGRFLKLWQSRASRS